MSNFDLLYDYDIEFNIQNINDSLAPFKLLKDNFNSQVALEKKKIHKAYDIIYEDYANTIGRGTSNDKQLKLQNLVKDLKTREETAIEVFKKSLGKEYRKEQTLLKEEEEDLVKLFGDVEKLRKIINHQYKKK